MGCGLVTSFLRVYHHYHILQNLKDLGVFLGLGWVFFQPLAQQFTLLPSHEEKKAREKLFKPAHHQQNRHYQAAESIRSQQRSGLSWWSRDCAKQGERLYLLPCREELGASASGCFLTSTAHLRRVPLYLRALSAHISLPLRDHCLFCQLHQTIFPHVAKN